MNQHNFTYRIFGRSKGRKKNKLDESVKKIKISKIIKSQYNIIDIGSGFGESTIEIAKKNSDNVVISCEKYIDGINNTANITQDESLNNLFIFQGNVHQLLDEYCSERSISEMWILFPDPWPKKKHINRRLIDVNFFKKIHKYLKKNNSIHIATDSTTYIVQILDCIYKIKKDYLWVNQAKEEWNYKYLSLPKTKYYKKALKNGLNPFYIKLIKL